MNIMVFNVAAENGGALSVLTDFIEEAKKDKGNKWYFVVSKLDYQDTENITFLKFSWIKKSRLHRLYFDHFYTNRLVKDYKIDKVFSMQNIGIPRCKVEQVVFVQNSLPFVEYKYSFSENRGLWIYQNYLANKIYNSIRQADKVIVQSKWMKQACIDKTHVNGDKIIVVPPKINMDIQTYFHPNSGEEVSFFYPAAAFHYKNHRVVIDAVKALVAQGYSGFNVIFTLKGDEDERIASFKQEAIEMNLPISFVGSLSRDAVFHYYQNTILLFPSFIETVGLPLLETRLHRGLILAADLPYAHEINDGYINTHFFNPFSVQDLVKKMCKILVGEIRYHEINNEHCVNLPNEKSMLSEVLK